jgi:hypothetical protein
MLYSFACWRFRDAFDPPKKRPLAIPCVEQDDQLGDGLFDIWPEMWDALGIVEKAYSNLAKHYNWSPIWRHRKRNRAKQGSRIKCPKPIRIPKRLRAPTIKVKPVPEQLVRAFERSLDGLELLIKRSDAYCKIHGIRAEPISGDTSPENGTQTARHSHDFRSVNWYGTHYSFTSNQAPIISLLWKAWKRGTPEVGDQSLLEIAEVQTQRMSVVFRDHAAWNTMIQPGRTRGTHRLAAPPA